MKSVYGKSQSAKCASNLRQVGVAVHLYMADHGNKYPPSRYNTAYRDEHGLTGTPYPQDILKTEGYTDFSGNPQSYQEAGIWHCPADTERPLQFATKSYGQNIYLGGDKRNAQGVGHWRTWMSSPLASEWSTRLIYMIDHNYNVTPKSSGGSLTHKSWPLGGGSPDSLPPAGKAVIDFRHQGTANALMGDGSVRKFTFKDLANSGSFYIWGGDF